MARHRTHSIEFKRQVAQEFLAGETLHGLAKRHDICRRHRHVNELGVGERLNADHVYPP